MVDIDKNFPALKFTNRFENYPGMIFIRVHEWNYNVLSHAT